MTPLDWIQMHPKSAQSISLEANILDYQWKWQVSPDFFQDEANGILRVCMSLHR
jgi:hypothetical protein